METPRHWRLKKQRYNLVGTVDPETGKPEFPPKNHFTKPTEVYNCKIEAQNSNLLLPNHQVIHSEVVGQDQKQNNEG